MNPFATDGCIEFNKQSWNLELVKKRYSINGDGPPYLDASLFIDRKGKICRPPWAPFLSVHFEPSETKQALKINKQWIKLATMLASDMKKIGIAESITLPLQISDARPWQWMGFKATVKYTYCIDFPFSMDRVDRVVRSNVNKALNAGYSCSRSNIPAHILACLSETEERNSFDQKLDHEALELGRQLIGDECYRSYVCYSKDGEPASAAVVLCAPNGWGTYWVAGTKTAHLTAGSAQLMINFVLEDLQRIGCVGFDFCGANMQSIARMKANWGARLVPYYVIEPYNMKTLSVFVKQCVKQRFLTRDR